MEFNIKDYIEKAKELEIAIYKQKQLMEKHEEILKATKPIEPAKPLYELLPVDVDREPVRGNVVFGICLLVVMTAICVVLGLVYSNMACYFAAVVFFGVCICVYRNNEQEYKDAVDRYDYMRLVNRERKEFVQNKNAKMEEKYNADMTVYSNNLSEYSENAELQRRLHSECMTNLKKALEEHYEMNVLFSKYRNLVAVTTIDEYLQSGRCSALEGAEGAYNLYEMELRQNIVIGQLSAVLSNMEQIKNNQYTLYQELAKANAGVSEIISEIKTLNSTAKLNAHFSYMNAKIAAAPKYIHGHIC